MLNKFLRIILSITRKNESIINAKASQFDTDHGSFYGPHKIKLADLESCTSNDKFILELQK